MPATWWVEISTSEKSGCAPSPAATVSPAAAEKASETASRARELVFMVCSSWTVTDEGNDHAYDTETRPGPLEPAGVTDGESLPAQRSDWGGAGERLPVGELV